MSKLAETSRFLQKLTELLKEEIDGIGLKSIEFTPNNSSYGDVPTLALYFKNNGLTVCECPDTDKITLANMITLVLMQRMELKQ